MSTQEISVDRELALMDLQQALIFCRREGSYVPLQAIAECVTFALGEADATVLAREIEKGRA